MTRQYNYMRENRARATFLEDPDIEMRILHVHVHATDEFIVIYMTPKRFFNNSCELQPFVGNSKLFQASHPVKTVKMSNESGVHYKGSSILQTHSWSHPGYGSYEPSPRSLYSTGDHLLEIGLRESAAATGSHRLWAILALHVAFLECLKRSVPSDYPIE